MMVALGGTHTAIRAVILKTRFLSVHLTLIWDDGIIPYYRQCNEEPHSKHRLARLPFRAYEWHPC